MWGFENLKMGEFEDLRMWEFEDAKEYSLRLCSKKPPQPLNPSP